MHLPNSNSRRGRTARPGPKSPGWGLSGPSPRPTSGAREVSVPGTSQERDDIGELTGHREVDVAVAVEIGGYGEGRWPRSGGVCRKAPEGAITVSQGHLPLDPGPAPTPPNPVCRRRFKSAASTCRERTHLQCDTRRKSAVALTQKQHAHRPSTKSLAPGRSCRPG